MPMLQPHASQGHDQTNLTVDGEFCVALVGPWQTHMAPCLLELGGLVPGGICCFMDHELHSSYLNVPGLASFGIKLNDRLGCGGNPAVCPPVFAHKARQYDLAFKSARSTDLR